MVIPDRELVERARQGDGAAIGELFSRYWRAARAAAFGITGEFASAEDAASEGFRQAWSGLHSLRDPERFGPWLRRIVVRKARLARKSRDSATGGTLDVLADAEAPPDIVLERLQLAALIQQLVRELPPGLREAVSLFYFEGYDSDTAARFLEIPAGTLRRRLHQGRERLRRAADHMLKRKTSMNGEREREIQRLARLFEQASEGDSESVYQAFRAALALRPAPNELVTDFMRRRMESIRQSGSPDVHFTQIARETARQLSGLSDRAADPGHPVGAAAARIRRALPQANEWTLDVGVAARQLLTFPADDRNRLRGILPPGFAEGRPGAFLRASRGLLLTGDDGSVRTTYQLLQDSPDSDSFRDGLATARISDVLDFSWLVAEPLELRSVQELLEQLATAVVPGVRTRVTHYEEPRYRAALRLQLDPVVSPAAVGGVLAGWQGQAPGVHAAHLRFFLEPWATVLSGQVVEFDRVPALFGTRSPQPAVRSPGSKPL
jgi:RNA polymerase sigma factor (sigma-70 family)